MTQQKEPGGGDSIGPLDWIKRLPSRLFTTSDRLGWVGLEAVHCRAASGLKLYPPALTHHRLFFFARPPEEVDLR